MAKKCYYTIERKNSSSIPSELWTVLDKLTAKYSLPSVDTIDISIYPETYFLVEAEISGEACVGAILPIFVFMLSDKDLEDFLELQCRKFKEYLANSGKTIPDKYASVANQWNTFFQSDEFTKNIALTPDHTMSAFESKVFPHGAERNKLLDYNDPEIRVQIRDLFETYQKLLGEDAA